MKTPCLPLSGKVAAITGAASGIGLACTTAFLAAGARVVMIDRDVTALRQSATALGENALPLVVDVTDPGQVDGLTHHILRIAGRLDIFHANAGMYTGGPFVDTDPAVMEQVLNLNVNATFRCIHAVLPHFITQQSGDILLTSSVAGVVPVVHEPVYTASKFAVQGFAHSLRRQLFPHGIRVSAILPGPVSTALLSAWPEAKRQEALEEGSLLQPSDVAEAVLFMVTRPRNITVRDLTLLPNCVDL
ncbi:SDR family oxidoreductase [Cedecea sp. NFIX57]|uniref:SDR family oxidoreductase n=1 Tax=Cedecea sp. NFIX57 TaxID=1566286 RepID=UPI000A0D2016|nr:SDR family oxidoreductase [Cedecea sp. NFIX57]SMG19734.1 ribitol 2-dehydrogenase [Cedecea sp. NFIX57]